MKQITSFILTALVAFAFVGCTEELLIEEPSSLSLDESNIIKTKLAVSVNGFAVTATTTRADDDPDNEVPTGETETMSDFEKTIDNIWVFQYDTSGDMLITPRYYTAEESYSDGTWDVVLEPKESTIYVVTNVNNDLWDSGSGTGKFGTKDLLLSETLPAPRFISDMSENSEEGHIPMQGCVEVEEGIIGNEVIVVPVEHMYAKLKMRFVIDDLLAQYDAVKVTNVSFSNIPYYCRVKTLYDETRASMDGSYPSDCWTSRYINTANNTGDPNNEGLENTYDYVIYVPENIQGETSNRAEDKKATEEDLPAHASNVTAYISYIDDDGAQRAASYSMYPGGNNYNNYNIRRNQVYRVTMNIAYPEEIVRQPSANCLFGFAGETIAFYPYYRVETGGYESDGDNTYTNGYQNEYHFENYLYPTPGDGSGYEGRKIAGLKIIWQTEDCIGNNSAGDKVYLVSTAAEGTHDGYEQIYVKTANEGNALIAAYADEACTGDILWSWHIWVRDPHYSDPTDLANAYPYYTYDWDKDGIYSYKYYTDLRQTPVRIPGYQIMSCNIGALQDEPNYDKNGFFGHHYNDDAPASGETDLRRIQYFVDGDGIVRTFGMMYQWGRKDPFPPLTTTIGGTGVQSAYNTGYYIQNYDDAHTQKLYGNDGETEVHKTSSGDASYLFHSYIAGEGEGMAYTIKHPTVFMCGTNVIAQTLADAATSIDKTDYVKSLSNYKYKGGWSEEDEYDNNEWGGLDISQSNKVLDLGFQDQEGFGIYLYEDYGTKKTIFDPCPYGWRVSSGDLWLGFTKNGVNAYTNDYKIQNQYNGGANDAGSDTDGLLENINYDPDKSCLLGMTLYLGSSWRTGNTTWFPTQGFLMPDGCGYRVGGCGNYVNANANSDYSTSYDRVYITHIHDRISTFRVFEHQLHYTVKSAANPLRCVRDTK